MSLPSLSYGVGYISDDSAEQKAMFNTLKSHGVVHLDSARSSPGSEKLIADIGAAKEFKVTTKAIGFRSGCGKKEAILQSANESLEVLGVEQVSVYLLYSPDPTTPISETMEAIQELYKQGRFERFGVSNFSAAQVQECYDYAKSKGYVLPTVYQANYNLLARANEKLLFPTLRRLGISIQAYSPIAGGFLAKSPPELSTSARWDAKGTGSGNERLKGTARIYNGMYNRPSLVEYLKQFETISKRSGISQVGIAYRWIRYHSALKEGDLVIVGTKSLSQLEQTLSEIKKGPLEGWVVQRLEEMWITVEKDAPVDNYQFIQAKTDKAEQA